nr:outer membrane beta-barrel protein [uncultured Dyadobacter sp.]
MNFPLLTTAVLFGMVHCITPPAQAQDKGKGELNATLGIYPVEDLLTTTFLVLFGDLFDAHKGRDASNPVFFLTYKYHVSDRFAIGGTTGYNRNSKSWDHYNSDGWRQRTLTSAMEGTFYWFKRPGVDFYSTAGAGFFVRERAYYETRKTTDLGTTMYIAPLGVRFGKDFGCFLEMGYGYKGIFNAGLSARF